MGELLNFLRTPDTISWERDVVTDDVNPKSITGTVSQSVEYRVRGLPENPAIRPRSNITHNTQNQTITFKNVHYMGNGEAVAEDVVVENNL
jgi:hypothetical protein